jgi:hypothetical protein
MDLRERAFHHLAAYVRFYQQEDDTDDEYRCEADAWIVVHADKGENRFGAMVILNDQLF